MIIRLSRMLEECKREGDGCGDPDEYVMGRRPRRAYRAKARCLYKTAGAVTPRGALRAQAVLSARTWTRFLPRDLARADEETARESGTQRKNVTFDFNREKRVWRYIGAPAQAGRRRPG